MDCGVSNAAYYDVLPLRRFVPPQADLNAHDVQPQHSVLRERPTERHRHASALVKLPPRLSMIFALSTPSWLWLRLATPRPCHESDNKNNAAGNKKSDATRNQNVVEPALDSERNKKNYEQTAPNAHRNGIVRH